MSFFDADSAQITKQIDRARLPIGTYLVKCADAVETHGSFRGNRIQIDFAVVRGPAPEGTVKGQIHMAQVDNQRQAKENGKIQKEIAAFLGIPPRGVTNEVFARAVRTRKERPGVSSTEILSESFPAKDSILYGKQCVVRCVPYKNKAGENTSYYEFEAYDPDVHTTFEEYDIAAERAKSSAPTLAEVLAEVPEVEIEPALPPSSPRERMEAAGWRPHPKNPAYVYLGKVARLADEVMAEFT